MGVDISKNKFDVAVIIGGKFKTKVLKNNANGFEYLLAWLERNNITRVHACMEATGDLYEALATFLVDHNHDVSVVNPRQISAFAKAQMIRTKTDAMDAKVIARFAEAIKPELWEPQPENIRKLRALGRRREALDKMLRQEKNRISCDSSEVEDSIARVISKLEQEIKDISRQIKDLIDNDPDLRNKKELLRSIPGIGEASVEVLLSETNAMSKFESVNQLVAYMGLSPHEQSSGTSVHKKAAISKSGNRRLRKALYMPAIVAKQRNPIVAQFAERLVQRGKNSRLIICACMRKLVHIAFGVIKNNTYFVESPA
jgi:transposase